MKKEDKIVFLHKDSVTYEFDSKEALKQSIINEYCASCGKRFKKNDNIYHENGDRYYCLGCVTKLSEGKHE